jgi:hypothetical protein
LVLRPWTIATIVLLVVVLAAAQFTFRDYGISWDERQQSEYGRRALRYYTSGGLDDSHAQFVDNYLYGAFYSALEAVAVRVLRPWLDEIEAVHLFSAIFGWTGLIAAAALAGLLTRARAAFLAVLFLATMPTWHGHLFNNTKDIPFAVMHAWSLVAIAIWLRPWPQLAWSRALAAGLVIGATMGIRVGGILLLGYVALALAALVALDLAHRRGLRGVGLAVRHGALVATAAYLTMLAAWPWAAESPLAHPLEGLRRTSDFHHLDEVLYRGALYLTTDLPWDYVPGWLLIQIPEIALAALLTGIVAIVVLMHRRVADGETSAALATALPLVAMIAPVVLFIVRRPVVYDAARHFLFVLPPLAVVAALGVDAVWQRVGRRRRYALGALVISGCAWTVASMATMHPYEYVYFNALVGGVRGAERRYDLDYWSQSLREATLKLRTHPTIATLDPSVPRRVYVCGSRPAAAYYFPGHWKLTGHVEEGDFAIILRRNTCNQPFRNRRVLLTVERKGVALAYVYDQRARIARRTAAEGNGGGDGGTGAAAAGAGGVRPDD